jgi:hypothetical protein
LVHDERDLVRLFSEAKSAIFDAIAFDALRVSEYVREYHSKISLVITDWMMPRMNGRIGKTSYRDRQ